MFTSFCSAMVVGNLEIGIGVF
jgi:hypothetical protein